MAEQDQSPVFQIQRIYLKDLSLEQPNSPQILLEQGQPQVEINLGLGAAPIGEGIYEVTVTATVTTKVNDKVLFSPEDRYEVDVQGEDYIILRERDIHAVASERIEGGTGLYL